MNSSASEKYRSLVFARIAKGRAVTKPIKKTPGKKAVPGKRAPGCTSSALVGKTLLKKSGANNAFELEQELAAMRNEGLLVCTDGIWWERGK